MKSLSTVVGAFVLAMSVFGAVACSGGGSGCGPTEEELNEQAESSTNQITTTCGPGTRLEGNTCVRNTQPVQTQATTLGGGN
ncbi:MAG: hypothetical protein SF051_16450 [Elusimicrobiota bacterium]|nr:hypothetical protein [Elusimicrobiota bacterium]